MVNVSRSEAPGQIFKKSITAWGSSNFISFSNAAVERAYQLKSSSLMILPNGYRAVVRGFKIQTTPVTRLVLLKKY